MSARRTTRRQTSAPTRRRASGPTRRRAGSTRRRSTRRSVSSTVGAALGTLLVGALLDLSWPARVGLLLAGLVLVLGALLWRNREEIAAGSEPDRAGAGGIPEPSAAPADAGLPESPPSNPPAPQDRPS